MTNEKKEVKKLSILDIRKKLHAISQLKTLEKAEAIREIVNKSDFKEREIKLELKEYEKQLGINKPIQEEDPFSMFGKIGAVRNFIKVQPLFYDRANIWWMWNHEETCWEMSDEVDILNKIRRANHDTVTSKEKAEIINALKQVGRENAPEEVTKNWIQFKDKIVDVETGEIFPATPQYFITNPIPFKIGESEETPTMDKYFGEWVIKEGLQDETYINTLYEIIAYSCMKRQFLQRLFAFVGSGSNGKGVYLSILKKFLGSKNVCSTELRVLANNQFESSALYKKQACFMGEVDAEDMRNTNLIKKLSGEDDIRYCFKGKTPFTEESSTTCFMNTNSLPVSPDKSKGFYRRWLIIDFPHEFKVGKNILAEIPEVEYENLAKKCIRICRELLESKQFTNEGDINTRIKRYEDRSNPMVRYIEDFCEEDPEKFIVLKHFVNKLNDYLKDNRLRIVTVKYIAKKLREEGFDVKGRRVYTGNEYVQTTCIFGLDLKDVREEFLNPKTPIDTLMENPDKSFHTNELNIPTKTLRELEYQGMIQEETPNNWRWIK